MAKVISTKFDTWQCPVTGARFEPILDQRTGRFVGVADVDAKGAAYFKGRPGFAVVTDKELQAMTSRAPAPAPERVTGELLADAAQAAGAGMPPEPPKG